MKNKFNNLIELNQSVNNNECTQNSTGFITYLSLYVLTCNNKASCNLIPSKVSLSNCGNQAANYFHVDYICTNRN